jgi:ATP-dependent Zn protease
MDTAVAGRVAEEVVYGAENAETGAMADFRQMMQLAKNYVLRYGFSEKVCGRNEETNNV